ncbi:MAG TPA: hypothetical protein VMY41_10795 [Thermohalobaculum sp.]|nr:hypothetical protein [Thermohalobaculum sp.]
MRTLRIDAELAATLMRSRSHRLIPAIFATALAVLLGAGTVAANAQEPMIEQCLDPATCPIPYVRLSKQDTEPFLFLGKVIDEKHPRYQDYKSAIRRFRDVRSCLTTEEREKSQPDLRQIEWGAIDNVKEMEVCVFRVISSFDDIETIKTWLRHHDFNVADENRVRNKRYVPDYETDLIFGLTSTLSEKKYREMIPRSWIARLIGFESVRIPALTIYFSQSWQVVGVAVGGSSILN